MLQKNYLKNNFNKLPAILLQIVKIFHFFSLEENQSVDKVLIDFTNLL